MADFSFSDWARIQQATPDINKTIQDGIDRGRQNDAYSKAQDALARVRANPGDAQARTDLAVYDPVASKAYENAAELNRQTQARSANAGLYDALHPQAAAPVQTGLSSLAAPVQASPDAQLPLSNLTPAPSTLASLAAPQAAPTSVLTPMPKAVAPIVRPEGLPAPTTIPAPSAQAAPDAAHQSLADHSNPALAQAGAAVTSGKMTAHDAVMAALRYANPAELDQTLKVFDSLDKIDRDKISESNDALGHAAYSLLSIPDDANHTARRAFLMEHVGDLTPHGVTPDQIQHLDLSDYGLNHYVGQALTVEQLITQSNKKADDARLDATQAETVRHNHAVEDKPIISPDGTIISPTGKVLYGNGSSTSPGAAPDGPPSARQAETRNPGNLKDGPFARSQPGYQGRRGNFAIFDTVEHGVAAQENLLRGNYNVGSGNSVNGVIDQYLGRGSAENSTASRANYKAYVAGQLGINPTVPLTAAQLPKLALAMRQFETGQRGGTASTQTAGGDPTLDYQAEQYRKTGKLPTGNGAPGIALRQRITERAAQLAQAQGMSGGQDADAQASYKNDNATLKTMQTQRDQIATSVHTAIANGQRYLETARALPYQTGFKPLNGAINLGLNAVSNPQLAAQHATANSFAGEIGKILTSTTGTGGVLSDSARTEALSVLESGAGYDAKKAAVDKLLEDANARLTSFDRSISARTYQRDHGHAPIKVNSPEEAARLPSGTPFVGHDGITRVRS